jgi:rhodanese-related sulfurtransferase/rubrerythrin
MFDSDFGDMTVEELKQFIQSGNEKDYLIVDVRQPKEYTDGHIPGAKFIPLNKLMADFSGLPQDRDLIFYCHSGGRSLAAASMSSEEMVTEKRIYNLTGGILAWEGKTLRGFPKVQVFDKNKSAEDLLFTAMDLEKGAWRFYTHILENFDVDPIIPTLTQLSKAEIGHAKIVFGFWKTIAGTIRPFEELYRDLGGEILEGGDKLSDMLDFLKNTKGNLCTHIIEAALHIEYAAFDLYRNMADNAEDQTARDAFIAIAQAEKNHMRTLAKALDQCK